MHPHKTGGQPMSSSQLQEMQKKQRLRQQQQTQAPTLQQQQQQQQQQLQLQEQLQLQQARAAQRQTHQIIMAQGLQMQHEQFGNQRWSGPAVIQRGGHMNSFPGANAAAPSFFQLHQQSPGDSQTAGNSSHASSYMNAASLPPPSGPMGSRKAQQLEHPWDQMSQLYGVSQERQNMGLPSSVPSPYSHAQMAAGKRSTQHQHKKTAPQVAAGITSAQYQYRSSSMAHPYTQAQMAVGKTTEQQHQPKSAAPKMAAGNTNGQHQETKTIDPKRQYHDFHGIMKEGISTSSSGSTLPSGQIRHWSGSSWLEQQKQAPAQMKMPRNSVPSVTGKIKDQPHSELSHSQNPRKMMNSRRLPQTGLPSEKSTGREENNNAAKNPPREKEATSMNESQSSAIIPVDNDEKGLQIQPSSVEEETSGVEEESCETNSNGSIAPSSSVSGEESEFLPSSIQENEDACCRQGDGSARRALQLEEVDVPSLATQKRSGVVCASPNVSWKKSATRVIDLTNSPRHDPDAKFSPHQLSLNSSTGMSDHRSSLGSSSSILDHRLSMASSVDSWPSDSSPRTHAGLRRSSSSTPQSISKKVRRSSRQSRPPPKLSPARYAPVGRKKKNQPLSPKSQVYGVELADNDDWSTYGRIARTDDMKKVAKRRSTKVLEVVVTPAACWSPLKPLSVYCENAKTKNKSPGGHVLDVEVASFPNWSELEPLSAWAEDAARQWEVLEEKQQGSDENVEILADWLASIKTSRRKRLGPVGVMEDTDILMMNNLEDEMDLVVPAFLTSDRETIEKICAESNSVTDRLDLDPVGDAWSRKHFNIPDPGVLSETELELAWLAEESLYCLRCPSWDWTFIWMHAPTELKSVLGRDRPALLVRPDVPHEFRQTRDLIKRALRRGYRRPRMRKVIARHQQLLREQAK